jgi:hypothetical protein
MADYLQRWPEPVDGAEVLYSIEAMLRRYLSMPEGSPELTTLWTMFTWCIDASDIAPRLFLTSPMRRCGKTAVLDILTALVHRPEANVNVTAASLYTAIDQEHCTLILDEADQWATKRGPVMGVLNSGHSRATAFVPRVIGGVSDIRPTRQSPSPPSVARCRQRLKTAASSCGCGASGRTRYWRGSRSATPAS